MNKYIIPSLILLIPFYFVRFALGSVPTTIIEVLIYLAFVYLLITQSGKIFAFVKTRAFTLALIFVVAMLIGAIVDPNLKSGLGLFKGYFFDGFLLFILIGALGDIQAIKSSVLASGAITAILSLVLFKTTVDGRLLDFDGLSPNYLAMYLTPIMALGAFEFQSSVIKKRPNYLILIALIIMLGTIYLTGSRGTMVGLLLALIFSFYAFYKDKVSAENLKKLKIGFILSSIIAIVVIGILFAPDITDHSRKATSSNIRSDIWKTTAEIIKLNPIVGVGLSNYQNYFSELTEGRVNYPEYISPQALSAHNLYLNLWATCGLIGLVAFMIFILKSGFWRKDQAVAVALVAILAYGLVDTPIFRNDLALIFWVLMAAGFIGEKDVAKN